ncbi:RNA polymerase II mediator complex protein [Coccidioides immitis RS]|uniref:Mediator of RNA polymerase II transcription subunit 7 n=1 Tax=Coccidioides immitis (strain RS) TaxID=246410 RepID=MED7_COCIM|nr:RNA polymerase II mediator complex protein [Coccidioides immitis RS]Q1E7S5.1 RecName: Full=Mediator of RNA polymerase II transcription subunit 7; AltName: Full=Mediator complex subunit 7 [Coccidioides immitis RS]EAS36034.3 RNA polymerase II mediator complex protein [Coccidioides immitis RS]TPX25790.1 Mediator of RNA polymerase II transcription subunit 7 [Coccidioides immitis]
MEEGGQQKGITAAFPPPPPFWKKFTPENLERLEKAKREAEPQALSRKWSPEALHALKLAPELRYLVPPELPKEGSYSLFGEAQSLSTQLPSLEEQGIEQLYPSSLTNETAGPSPDHAYYLLKISKSLLLNFLELVGILSINPEQYEPKIEDIRNLFINAHHLLNLYRPHQSRESLITMMEEQLEQAKEEIREMEQTKERVEIYLRELEAEGRNVSPNDEPVQTPESGPHNTKTQTSESQANGEQVLWKLLDKVEES